jgi:hypothetical protein
MRRHELTHAEMTISPEDLAKSGSEHAEQCAVFCWAALNTARYPCLEWIHAIPNGGGRSRAQGAMLKAEGVKPGVADIMLPVARGLYHGLYIEMKRRNGTEADIRPAQRKFLTFVHEQGYFAVVCYGWEQAVGVIEHYLRGTRYATA